jgi:hypothetical protein
MLHDDGTNSPGRRWLNQRRGLVLVMGAFGFPQTWDLKGTKPCLWPDAKRSVCPGGYPIAASAEGDKFLTRGDPQLSCGDWSAAGYRRGASVRVPLLRTARLTADGKTVYVHSEKGVSTAFRCLR